MNSTLKLLTQQLADAEAARKDTLAAQHTARLQLAEAERRAEQLMLYRHEYENGWGCTARNSGDPHQLRHYREIMARLCRDIDEQQALGRTAAAKLTTLRATLRNRESQLLSINTAIARQHKLLHKAPQAQQSGTVDGALARFRETLFALTTSDMPFGAVPA